MKSRLINILAILAIVFSLINSVNPAAASGLLQEIQGIYVPSTISYQGYVSVDGQPYDGSGYFKFALVSPDGSTTHWSNDGTSTNGRPPDTSVRLTVSNGQFSVLLGEVFFVDGMTEPIDAQTIFRGGNDLHLRVWFSSDDDGPFTQLSPDRALSSVPYALVADYTENAHKVDGKHAADFADASHDHDTQYAALGHDHNAFYAAIVHNHDSLYQKIVSGVCTPGSTIQSINTDGSVNCQVTSPHPGYSQIASGGAQFNSIARGSDELGLISFYQVSGANLTIKHCSNLKCNTATTSTLDSTNDVGQYTSIAIGEDGLGLISYYDVTNTALKVAHCSNLECSTATITQLDNSASVGKYTSITIGEDGLGLISYFDETNGDLKVAHCSDVLCSAATTAYLSDTPTIGYSTSITIDANGRGLVSYATSIEKLELAECSNTTCSTLTKKALLGGLATPTGFTSITLGVDGIPIVTSQYQDYRELMFYRCADTTCSSWTAKILDSNGDVGTYSSLITGSDGFPAIAYHNATSGKLNFIHCEDRFCNNFTQQEMEEAITYTVGLFTAIAIGADGYPLIAHFDDTNDDFRLIHCKNVYCSPYMMDK